jgi:hypothetical protein
VGVGEVEHQAAGLVTPGGAEIGDRVIRAHPGGLKQVTHPHQSVGIQEGTAHTAAGVNPGFITPGHLNAQPPARQGRDRCTEAAQQGLHLGGAQVVVQGVGKQPFQRVLVMARNSRGWLVEFGHATAHSAEAVMTSSAAAG